MAKSKQKSTTNPVADSASESGAPEASADLMSQCVSLCQQQRWREALTLFMKMCDKAQKDNNTAMLESLQAGRTKVEYSLRRQMAASLIHGARQLLAEEYLLDVGE